MATTRSDTDSMCSIPLTVVVNARSVIVTIRFLHLGRGQAGVVPDNGDDRDVDGGEDVDRHRHDRRDAQDGNQRGHDDERIRPSKRESDDPHTLGFPYPPTF